MSQDVQAFQALREEAKLLSIKSDDVRSAMLEKLACALENNKERIYEANRLDLEAAKESGTASALLNRLKLDESKLAGAIEGVRAVAALPSPVGKVREKRLLDEGLILEKRTYPLGVIGMVFEARPDALIQIVSLAIKSANGIVLKGGKEAQRTNETLVEVIRENLDGAPFLMLLSSHGEVDAMLKMEGYVDLIIPRGSNAFVRYCMEHTHIPVMGHADGICSVYVDESADLGKAFEIALDSKIQYPAACNAAETLLVNRKIAPAFLPKMAELYEENAVTMYCDGEAGGIIGSRDNVNAATETSWDTEYLSLSISVKVVEDIDEAMKHIAAHGSHHTDCIVTESEENKKRFFDEVDSADVFANCSTRFADGFRFGLGAEVGISTSKLHARGPVGLDGLVTTKWLLSGSGQVVKTYSGKNAKPFLHKEMEI